MKWFHLNSIVCDVARLMKGVRNRIDSPTAGFFLPDHDPPLLIFADPRKVMEGANL